MPASPVSRCTDRTPFTGWVQRAADDGRNLDCLFARSPDANIGILMGRKIRPGEWAFAMGVDPRHGGGGSLGRLRERADLTKPAR
jgi:hypothetical protein